MVLAVGDIEEVVEKLGRLSQITPPPAGVVPEHFYALGAHVASSLTGRTEPLLAADYYKTALGHRRETHRAPSGEEIVGVARAVFPALFGDEVGIYMANLDRAEKDRYHPHH